MENIKKSLEVLAKVANHRAVVNDFARSKYIERFGNKEKPIGTYHAYDGYDIISETKLKVKYTYGAGDMDFNDFFIIEFE
jgi:hypothetical protein